MPSTLPLAKLLRRALRARRLLLLLLAVFAATCTKKGQDKSAASTKTDADVVVVGAGLAGLTAAYELQKSGLQVAVLEAAPSIGGRVGTTTYGPHLTAEVGMQEIWEDSPLLALARELQVPVDGSAERAFSSVLMDGQVQAFDQASSQAFREKLLGPQESVALAAWWAQAKHLYERARDVGLADPEVQHLQDISLADWLTQSRLADKAVQWLRLTVEGELATEAEKTSALAALLDMEMFFGEGLHNYHVQGGNLRVIEALARPLGERLQTAAQVTAVQRKRVGEDAYVLRVRYERDHRTEVITARRVVLAVPSVRLHQIQMDPPLPTDYWQGINSLSFGHYVVVHFLVPSMSRRLVDPEIFPVLAGGPLGVIYGLEHNGQESPPQDIFGLLIYGEPARQFHMMPRESRVADLRAGLAKLWPTYAQFLGDAFVYSYHPSALPVWPPGRSAIDTYAQTLRQPHMGLHLAGDYTEGSHATGAVRSGLQVARTIAADLK